MTKNEGLDYFSSLIVGIDLGYYFDRFGLSIDNNTTFDNKELTTYYKEGMQKGN